MVTNAGHGGQLERKKNINSINSFLLKKNLFANSCWLGVVQFSCSVKFELKTDTTKLQGYIINRVRVWG